MENKIYKYLWKMSLYINQNKLNLSDKKDGLSVMDQWIIEKCRLIIKKYLDNIKDNKLDEAKELLDNFFINDFYKLYRLVFENKIKSSKDFETSENVLLNVYLEILKMYFIYYPNIIKFIYSNLYHNSRNSLYNDNLNGYYFNETVLSFGEDIKNIFIDITKFRMETNISKKGVIDSVTLGIKKDDAMLFSNSLNDILKLINAKNVNIDFGNETYVESISNDKINVKKR